MELQFGYPDAPKLYDFKDVYEFFDPIEMYKSKEGEILQMDYSKFLQSQLKYKDSIEELNKKINSLKDVTPDINGERKLNKLEEELKGDGVDEGGESGEDGEGGEGGTDDILPIGIDEEVKGVDENKVKKAKKEKNVPIAMGKKRTHSILSTYFSRFVPLYNKHICTCCGTPKNIEDYYITHALSCGDRVDENGNLHMGICKECVQRMFMYYYVRVANKNIELTMQYMCSQLNMYWDVNCLILAREAFEKKERKGTLIGEYIKIINKEYPGMTFMDSPFLMDKYSMDLIKQMTIAKAEGEEIRKEEDKNGKNGRGKEKGKSAKDSGISDRELDDETYDWSLADYNNKKEAIKIVGYDPFPLIKDPEDKKTLYRDLLNLIDGDDVAQDYIKVQSAISIVKSFFSVRQLDRKQAQLEEEGASTKEIKDIADLKKKELDSVNAFAANNGWIERYKTKVSKGENTFTGIMKAMDEKMYENELINKYDIATSSSIQQIADASIAAIAKQLSMSDAEMWQVAAEQHGELVKLRRANDNLEEECRKLKYELAKVELEKKAQREEAEKNGTGIIDGDGGNI